MTPYATLAEVLARYPAEATILAADEVTRERDDARIEAALMDASTEVRSILIARYTAAELEALDADSRALLRLYTIDIALYRVALSYNRSSERIKERYEAALKRLEAISKGLAALTLESAGGGGAGPGDVTSVGPSEPIVEANERIFTRHRMRGL